nr:MAG TPA: hypothetical protein [Caudoviricetes sp.]
MLGNWLNQSYYNVIGNNKRERCERQKQMIGWHMVIVSLSATQIFLQIG